MPQPSAADAILELLRPFALEDFLSGPYGRHPWHGRPDGHSRRAVIAWDDVNRALDCARAWDDRTLRLALHGKPVPASDYCVPLEGPAGLVWRPVADLVARALRAGATLVANGIDGVIPRVGTLAQSIEAVLPVRVQANLYVSSKGVVGFPRHEDSHDVLVVHLAGRKRWTVVSPACDASVTGSSSYLLQPGDLLYLPQGCAHDATAESDACLHLSFALIHLQLGDIAREVVRAMIDTADDGRPLYDLHHGARSMAAHVDELARRLQLLQTDQGFASRLLSSLLDSRRVRPAYRLPVVTGSRLP